MITTEREQRTGHGQHGDRTVGGEQGRGAEAWRGRFGLNREPRGISDDAFLFNDVMCELRIHMRVNRICQPGGPNSVTKRAEEKS